MKSVSPCSGWKIMQRLSLEWYSFSNKHSIPHRKWDSNHTGRSLPLQLPKFMIKEHQLCSYVSFFCFEQPLQNDATFPNTCTYLTCHPAENMLYSHTNYWYWLRHLNVSSGWAQRVPKLGWRSVCLKLCHCLLDIYCLCSPETPASAELETALSTQATVTTLGRNKELRLEKKGKMDRRGNIIFHQLWLTLQKAETYVLGYRIISRSSYFEAIEWNQ